jgi:hypothetical protein
MWKSVPPSIKNLLAIAEKPRTKCEDKSVGLQRNKCQTLEQTIKKKEQRWMDKENITSMKSKDGFFVSETTRARNARSRRETYDEKERGM